MRRISRLIFASAIFRSEARHIRMAQNLGDNNALN